MRAGSALVLDLVLEVLDGHVSSLRFWPCAARDACALRGTLQAASRLAESLAEDVGAS